MNINEPKITPNQILKLNDQNFNPQNICIVSGAGTGIGRAVAIAAAFNGILTVGLDINEAEGEKTKKLAEDIGGKLVFIKTDLANDKGIETAVEEASKLGKIKFLANIAGIQHIDPIENFPMEKYDLMQKIMLRAPFFLSKLVIPYMKNQNEPFGVIANMASVHAHVCTINKSVYNITKFGLRALSQSISAEGNGKIRSFTISSGFVKTPLALNQIPSQAKQRGITAEQVVTDVMMGKSRVKEMMSPIEVANLFIFGFSKHSKYLIGGDLLFDGGMTLTY
ncbi:MAG: SDR family oxidoreductase [Deltaproteobacteria bacterium]|nr:SDR family oxidoreductase [Deltaproteobacteria bacterium]